MNTSRLRPRHYAILRRWTVPSIQLPVGTERPQLATTFPKHTGRLSSTTSTSSTSVPISNDLRGGVVTPVASRPMPTTIDTKSSLTTAGFTSKKKGGDDSTPNAGGLSPTPRSPPNSQYSREEKKKPLAGIKAMSPLASSRDIPRRVVVIKESGTDPSPAKRNVDVDNGHPSNKNSPDGDDISPPKQQVVVTKRRFPLDREITDSSGKTIWIPGHPVIENGRVVVTQLPQIRATAWLDPSMYCRDGGNSIAGSDAARKLLRGKKDLMELLGHAVHNAKFAPHPSPQSEKPTERQRSYILLGHGVPSQMLQHHIDFAASLLTQLDAGEVSFKQFNVARHHNSLAASDAVRDVRWAHIRDAITGESQAVRWPLNDDVQWKDDLQLYWTVMNRIATRLGLAVLLKRPKDAALIRDSHNVSQPTSTDHYSLPLSASNSLLKTPPHHWKVKFSRHLHFALEQFPPGPCQLYPTLEWAPMDGVTAPGHFCIRLQGLSSPASDDESVPVSLFFDACFRTNLWTSYGTL